LKPKHDARTRLKEGVFAEDNEIVISWIGRHTHAGTRTLTEQRTFLSWADIGRPRKDQPRCCHEHERAPVDQDLVEMINTLRGPRG
jgi:hypothetical protein